MTGCGDASLSVISRVQESHKRNNMQEGHLPFQEIQDAGGLKFVGKIVLGEKMRKRIIGKLRERYADLFINLAKNIIDIIEGASGISPA